MSFVLLAVPLVSFGAGYFYGSYGTNNTPVPVAPPLSPDLINEIQKGIPLNHIEVIESHVSWSPHDFLLRQIQKTQKLKKPDKVDKVEENMITELRKKLENRRNKIKD